MRNIDRKIVVVISTIKGHLVAIISELLDVLKLKQSVLTQNKIL